VEANDATSANQVPDSFDSATPDEVMGVHRSMDPEAYVRLRQVVKSLLLLKIQANSIFL